MKKVYKISASISKKSRDVRIGLWIASDGVIDHLKLIYMANSTLIFGAHYKSERNRKNMFLTDS
jgi:hypothetical protein